MATSTTGVRGTATLQASTSVGAGSSQNSSSIDLTTKLLADLRGLITNGGALGAQHRHPLGAHRRAVERRDARAGA